MKRNLTASISTLLVATLALAACSTGGESAEGGEVVYEYGAQTPFASFDPAAATVSGMNYLRPIYDTVLRYDQDGTIVANLATEWSYDEARTTLSLTLQEGITFSDGTPLDAEAVATSLEANAAGSGYGLTAFASVTAFEASGPDQVTITLSQPDPGIEAGLATGAGMIASPTAIANGTLDTEPVGSGPFVLDEANSTAGTLYSYDKRDDAWNAEEFAMDAVTVRFLNDDITRFNALASGEVDAIDGSGALTEQSRTGGYEIASAPGLWQGLWFPDLTGKQVPALGDVRVRQAINYAIDRESIFETLYSSEGAITTQSFSRASPVYDPALDDAYPYDPEKAKELIAEAGYADGITIPTYGTAFMDNIQPTIEANLAAVGITVTFEREPIENLFGGGIYDYPMHFWYYGGDIEPWLTVTQLFTPDAVANRDHVTDPTLERLIETIRVSTGEEQANAYAELNAYIVEQAWAAPFVASDQTIIHNDEFDFAETKANLGDLRTITPATDARAGRPATVALPPPDRSIEP